MIIQSQEEKIEFLASCYRQINRMIGSIKTESELKFDPPRVSLGCGYMRMQDSEVNSELNINPPQLILTEKAFYLHNKLGEQPIDLGTDARSGR